MTRRGTRIVLSRLAVALVAAVAVTAPVRAQEPGPGRLEELRFQRMQEALRLNDAQLETLRQTMERRRQAYRQAMESQRRAMQRLQTELRREHVDERAVDQALRDIDAQRDLLERLRQEQDQSLRRVLTPEQRAKFLLFNRRFDERLRQLMRERAGRRAAPRARPPVRRPRRGPGAAPGDRD